MDHCLASPIPNVGFLRIRQIIGDKKTPGPIPVSRSTWWQGVKDGRFPQPVKLGPRTTAWTAQSVLALIEKLKEGQANG